MLSNSMLLNENRLRDKKEIARLFKSGRSVSNGFVFFRFAKSQEQKKRFAIVIGLKYSKSAVKRNRLRRRIRAVLKELLPQIKNGYDIIVGVNPKLMKNEPTLKELHNHLESCINKII